MTRCFVGLHSHCTHGRGRVARRGALHGALALILLGLAAPVALAQNPAPSGAAPVGNATAADGGILKVVILSRHGVRSPLVKPDDLAKWRPQGAVPPWPKWLCPDEKHVCDPGELTPHGAELAEKMGVYYRSHYPPFSASCPDRDEVYFWADTDQRTIATGQALLRGLVPDCDRKDDYLRFKKGADERKPPATAELVPPGDLKDVCETVADQHEDKDKDKNKNTDEIFHPVTSGGACPLDVPRALAGMRSAAGRDFTAYLDKIRKPLQQAQCRLQCCLEADCAGWPKACGASPPPQQACGLAKDKVACFNRLPAGKPATRILLGGKVR